MDKKDKRVGKMCKDRIWKHGYVLESTSGDYYVGITDELFIRLLII